MTGLTSVEEKWYVKSQNIAKIERRQDDLPYFLTEMLMSIWGSGGGVCSSPQKHLRWTEIDYQLPPKTGWEIRNGMRKTKGLAKRCPKKILQGKGSNFSHASPWPPDCKIQWVLSLSDNKLQTKLNTTSCFLTLFFHSSSHILLIAVHSSYFITQKLYPVLVDWIEAEGNSQK